MAVQLCARVAQVVGFRRGLALASDGTLFVHLWSSVKVVILGFILSAVIAEGRYHQPGRPILWAIGSLLPVRADIAMLRQVWFNLIDNAVKYSGKNPHPKIAIACRLETATREVVFSVAHNGVGFDPDRLPGDGHGLTNLRRRAGRLGGECLVESHPGSGTRVVFQAPINSKSS